ncbi:MAG: hypothetical protein KJ592_00535 [Nanoarchaeota archaeon]|nr:hypothetical protein [Nanoarchaeota archaeon]
MKFDFKNLLIWISLLVGVGMVLWRVFGNSPTDLELFVPFLIFGFGKVWSIGDRVTRLEMNTKHGFEMMKRDMNLIKDKLDSIEGRLG